MDILRQRTIVYPMLALLGAAWLGVAYAQTPPAPTQAAAPDNAKGKAAVTEPFADIAGMPQDRLKSLLFTPEEVADIRYAINIYRKHATGKSDTDTFDEEDFLNRLTGIRKAPQANQFFTYPQFFLQSLVFHSPSNWVVWIENQKLTQDSPKGDAELSVVNIDQDKVSLQWRPVSMEKVNAIWDKMPNNEANVNKREGTVIFTLRPNQTFSSYVMRPLEGKVQPVTVDTHNIQLPEEEEVPRAPQADGLPEEAPAIPESQAGASQKKQGLGGLIGAYSNIGKDVDSEPPAAPVQEKKP